MSEQRVAMVLGDAGGISAELVAKFIADSDSDARDLMVIGDYRLLQRGMSEAGVAANLPIVTFTALDDEMPEGSFFVDLGNCDPQTVPLGKSSAKGGLASVQNFRAALLAAHAGYADIVLFTPFNKHAMRLAEPSYVDEIGFIDATINAPASGREFNVLDEVWNARVTSHIPLSEVASRITEQRIFDSLCLTEKIMRNAGIADPRIGVAALNPHAGDGRNFGTEDEDVILPAVERAKARGFAVTGPIPSDTVFVRALRGEFDAVMTMFHDQGQIAMKLIGFDRGVTLIANYPFPIVTPAHGTAYDIAGKGKADLGATRNAMTLGRKLAKLNNRKVDFSSAPRLSDLFARALDQDIKWKKETLSA
ncbi:MAG: 4-hydroxythreonine-4-phosphate dehydrogenase PdxA [Roseovarius sp.]|nr:4-hydroxythreonine-4-phosphate dehydrogenase PdxA [Roseovarius sp.]